MVYAQVVVEGKCVGCASGIFDEEKGVLETDIVTLIYFFLSTLVHHCESFFLCRRAVQGGRLNGITSYKCCWCCQKCFWRLYRDLTANGFDDN